MGGRGNPNRILCVNCNICVNIIQRYPALQLDTKVISVLCTWADGQIITEDDYVCEACRDLAISQVNNDLLGDFSSSEHQAGPSRPRGHRSVCTLCGCSILRRQSDIILRENPSHLHQCIFNIIQSQIAPRQGYAPLYNSFDQFYSRYVYRRVRHIFNRPICSTPGAEVTLKERATDDYNWSFRFTGTEKRCINLGSYNYLGFAAPSGDCADAAEAAARRYGLTLASPRAELGSTPLHKELEETTAAFLGVESAVVFGMGFATNALGIPGLMGRGTLVLSDENNHASLILGLRLAHVTVRVFSHNDMQHLERRVRDAIAEGHWKKIIVMVEGVYSMEGSIVPLSAMVALKKKYGFSLYLDEAHSVGAMGPRGRGVVDHCGVNPADVDILMGTFTKSFGAAGGYIAGSAKLIESVRAHGHAHPYAHSMSPPVCAQVLAAMRAIASPAGVARVRALRDNTHHFRRRLRDMGVVVFGHEDSPVVPMLVYTFSKMAATVEGLTKRGVATVGVGFPATPLNKARIRFCLSAAHTRAQLDECLQAVEEVVEEVGLRYSRQHRS